MANRIVLIGTQGTDGPVIYIDANGHVHRIPGWTPDQLRDLSHAIKALGSLSQVKAPGIAERVGASLHEFVSKEIGAHLQAGDIVVLG